MKVDNKANVYFIETFGAFDGPGIRYILFLQGCLMKCKFCHNRDSWDLSVNKEMTVEEILNDYRKYKGFYKNGGITVSGGEPLIQIDFLIDLFKACKQEGIHTCIDTSAGCYNHKMDDKIKTLMAYTDLVLLDIKHIDNEKHKDLTGMPNTHILEFAKLLNELNVLVRTRHVLIPTINDGKEDLTNLRLFLDTLTNVEGIDILPYHTKGKMKWEKMGLVYPLDGIREANSDDVKKAELILKAGYKYKTT